MIFYPFFSAQICLIYIQWKHNVNTQLNRNFLIANVKWGHNEETFIIIIFNNNALTFWKIGPCYYSTTNNNDEKANKKYIFMKFVLEFLRMS